MGTAMPFATTKEVMIQVDWSVEAPRLPAMVGSETLAMVVSSTWVKVPIASANAVRARASPLSGACGFLPAALTGPSSSLRAVGGQNLLHQGVHFGVDIFAGIAAHHANSRRVG